MKLTEESLSLEDDDCCIGCKSCLWSCRRLQFLQLMAKDYKMNDIVIYKKCRDRQEIRKV